MTIMRRLINKIISITGFQVRRIQKYPITDIERRFKLTDIQRRFKLFETFGINKIIDVGANVGQYALKVKELGFSGQIISFEPLSSAFSILKEVSAKYNNWQAHNYALGNENMESVIHVSQNSISSSILNMLPQHLKSAPASKFINTEKIQLRTLDSIFDNLYTTSDKILLKIDVQGFEEKVLEGARNSLHKIVGIQLEMSIVPLYEGELLLEEMIVYLKNSGFTLYSLENGFYDQENGQLLQVDGVFFRNSSQCHNGRE
jgi:FkbM family methyltransferase